jgi:hypothetical protein
VDPATPEAGTGTATPAETTSVEIPPEDPPEVPDDWRQPERDFRRKEIETRYLAMARALRAEKWDVALEFVSRSERESGDRSAMLRMKHSARQLKLSELGEDDIEVLGIQLSDEGAAATIRARIRVAGGAEDEWKPIQAKWVLEDGVWFNSRGSFKFP